MTSGHSAPLARMQLYIARQCEAASAGAWCYHTQYSYHLRFENLALPLFFKAVKNVLDRHPVLKTVLVPLADGAIGQAVDPQLALTTAFEDISTLPAERQDDWVRQYLLADRERPFALFDQGVPLCRSALIKRSRHSVQLILVIHHVIWDGWSLAVLLKEIFAVYAAYQDQPTLKLAPARYEYRDFFEAESAARPAPEAAQFWARHLRAHVDFHPPQQPGLQHRQNYQPEVLVLPSALTGALEQLARRLRVTMKAVFIAVFLRMVQDETLGQGATIGVVSNGRGMALANPLGTLGLLWNLAPLCVAAHGDDEAHVKSVHQALAQSAPFCTYPLLDILAERGTDTLFHAAFNYIDFGGAHILPPRSGIEFIDSGGLDKFDFPLHLLVGKNPFNREVSLVLNYDARCYSASAMRARLEQVRTRLERLGAGEGAGA